MKYILLLALFLIGSPVFAEQLSPDLFIRTYDSSKKYETTSKYVNVPAKKHMYKEINTNEVQVTSQVISQSPKKNIPFVFPIIISEIVEWFKNRYASAPAPQKIVEKKMKGITLTPALAVPISSPWYSTFFVDPYSDAVPQAVKDVYTWDRLWNPAYNPQQYLQCTTYVAMIYNLNGISLKGKLQGDAKDWIILTNTFDVFESGKSTDTPRMMDIMVWAENGANHVGVVIYSLGKTVTVINSNSSKLSYSFFIAKDEYGVTTIENKNGESSTTAWVPSHWLRIKK